MVASTAWPGPAFKGIGLRDHMDKVEEVFVTNAAKLGRVPQVGETEYVVLDVTKKTSTLFLQSFVQAVVNSPRAPRVLPLPPGLTTAIASPRPVATVVRTLLVPSTTVASSLASTEPTASSPFWYVRHRHLRAIHDSGDVHTPALPRPPQLLLHLPQLGLSCTPLGLH